MPIKTQDIKLLKSAVMADTGDGGGAMTGAVVVDGQSNNLFPDTSAMDRAFGRFQARKVFGVAQTADTDTLMGSHAIITQAPGDSNVACALVKTANWADTRADLVAKVQNYLVKGPSASARIYDTHYAGSLQLRLYNFVGADFPAGGDCVVLRNASGTEQYVRILRVAVATQNIAVVENGNALVLAAQVATCDLAQPLAMDVLGPPAQRAPYNALVYATLYSTVTAGGAAFYGIKPLAAAAAPGDYSALAAGGIYSPIVPAATAESPITAQYPLTGRASVMPTAVAAVTLPAAIGSIVLGPDIALTLPTAIQPGSLSISSNGYGFTDDGAGNLLQGTNLVGTVRYTERTITMLSSSPHYSQSYGLSAITVTYRPATAVGASAYSAALKITSANQGLAFTNTFTPPPAPGSFKLSYMAQGRWYELTDNANGKLAGSSGSYGVGTVDYAGGTMGVTLGAVPDVDSVLLADWGDPASAKALATALPTRLGTSFALDPSISVAGINLTWTSGGAARSATTNAAGQFTGDATGYAANGRLRFEPNAFPDGSITNNANLAGSRSSAYTGGPGGDYTLTGPLPVVPGTFRATVVPTWDASVVFPVPTLPIFDGGDGLLYVRTASVAWEGASSTIVGTINYTTGAVHVYGTISPPMTCLTGQTIPAGWQVTSYVKGWVSGPIATPIDAAHLTALSYATGSTTPNLVTVPVDAWTLQLDTLGTALVLSDMCFTIGGSTYTAQGGVLRRGWDVTAGAPTVANAGIVDSSGQVTVTALPSNNTNGVTWYNAAQDMAARQVGAGVFRTASAPLKTGVFQIQSGANSGAGNDGGVLSGGTWGGSVDYLRGFVQWASTAPVDPATLNYNAVFLQYLPLDAGLLGLDTSRLPLDGKVPIYRVGDLVVVHNTLATALPNPVTRGTAYDLGRQRIASVRARDALGTVLDDTLYSADLNAGTLTVPAGSDISAYSQPFTVEHRIEDMMLLSQTDISGKLSFTRSLTHAFPKDTSFVSSALPFGDLYARAYNYIAQATWTSEWSDSRIGAAPATANFNNASSPITVTNRGAIKERWLIQFTGSTTFNVIGQSVGVIATGSTGADCAPLNPATGAPYFNLPALGWGSGWAIGNVLRFNTDACGSPFWPVRTVLQGPATLDTDQFTLAFRGDVDRP